PRTDQLTGVEVGLGSAEVLDEGVQRRFDGEVSSLTRRQQQVDLAPQLAIAAASLPKELLASSGLELERRSKDLVDFRQSVAIHGAPGRGGRLPCCRWPAYAGGRVSSRFRAL